MKKSTKEIVYWAIGLAVAYYLYTTYANNTTAPASTGQ